MSYKIKVNYAHRSNYGNKRSLSDIKWLVYHYTANDGDSDEGNGNFFHNNPNRYASAHYFVDDDSVTKSVAQSYIAWHCGSETGKYFNDCRNANSVGIEMCDTKKNGKHDLSAKTRANAIVLGRAIVKKRLIPQSKVCRHYDVTHKACPAFYVGTGSNNTAWKAFRAEIFEGYAIGGTYKCLSTVKVRKAPGSNNFTGYKVKEGTKIVVEDTRYSVKGNLYIKVGENRWVLAKTPDKTYFK